MRLNHQRITLARFVVNWLVQPAFPIPPFFVFPCVNAGPRQVDIFELWIGVPDNPRSVFVCSNEHWRLIEPLFHSDLETAICDFGSPFAMPCDLPRTIDHTPVFGGAHRLVHVVEKPHYDTLVSACKPGT